MLIHTFSVSLLFHDFFGWVSEGLKYPWKSLCMGFKKL